LTALAARAFPGRELFRPPLLGTFRRFLRPRDWFWFATRRRPRVKWCDGQTGATTSKLPIALPPTGLD
jgi:hypothetical protein